MGVRQIQSWEICPLLEFHHNSIQIMHGSLINIHNFIKGQRARKFSRTELAIATQDLWFWVEVWRNSPSILIRQRQASILNYSLWQTYYADLITVCNGPSGISRRLTDARPPLIVNLTAGFNFNQWRATVVTLSTKHWISIKSTLWKAKQSSTKILLKSPRLGWAPIGYHLPHLLPLALMSYCPCVSLPLP